MKKYLCLFLCACLLLPLLAGCQNDEEATTTQPTGTQPAVLVPPTTLTEGSESEDNIPTIDENYWELLCENSDITLYSMSTMQNFLTFQLISARNLEGETVKFTSNFGGSAILTMEKTDPVKLSPEVFLAYQGIDWAALEGDAEKLNALRKSHDAAIRAAQETLPSLYSYRVTLALSELGMALEQDGDKAQLITLTVTIGDQAKTYSLDNVQILRKDAVENENFAGLATKTWAISDYAAEPGVDGLLELPTLRYQAREDIVLESFSVPGVELQGCDLLIVTALGDRFNLRWDCHSPIEVDAGSEITMENVVIRDAALADKLISNSVRYIVVNYTMDGENYNTAVPVSIRMRVEPWDAYAWYVDGVDMLPYYMEYVNYNG